MTFGKLVGPDIAEMIANREFTGLRAALRRLTPVTVAEIFADMPPEEVAVVFRLLPREFAADIFEYMPFELQEQLLKNLGNEQVAAVLNAMAPDDRTALLEELPAAATRRLLALLSPEERRVATDLLGYPPKSVGRIMTPDYVSVAADWTVAQVMEHIRRVGHDKETLNVIYVADERGLLIDDIRLRELVLMDPAVPLSEKMDRQFFALRADQDQEVAVQEFQRLDRVALPVVDSQGVLVGMVTVDDVLDIAQEEVTEDIQKMAAVQTLEAPYMDVSLRTMIRKRAIWLSVLLFGEMFTTSALLYFEDALAKAVVLTLFIPLIISSGGNSGSQATSLIVRSLAVGEVALHDWWRIFRRELASGFALGAVLGLIALARVVFWPWRMEQYGEHYVLIGLTVAAALVGVVLYGTLVGSMLPLILRKLGLDPAVASAPFVATLVDVTGIIIYFTVAMLVLKGTLL